MPQTSTHKYLLADARKALADGHLLNALDALHGMAVLLKAGAEADALEALANNYRMMLDYFRRGADDPERQRMYRLFVRNAHEWCFRLARLGLLTEENSFYTSTRRTLLSLKGADCPVSELLRSGTPPRDLFDWLWTMPPCQAADERTLSDFLATATTSPDTHTRQCLAVSALTLSAMQFFDVAKYRLLLDTCLSADIQLRVRALVGLVAVHLFHNAHIARYPEETARLQLLLDVPGLGREMEMLQAQLLLSLETQRIERGLVKEIMPEVMKKVKELRLNRNIGLEAVKDKLSEIDLNPEWEKDGTPSKLADFMQEFINLQERGADMYLASFKMIRQRFPFFNQPCNWFWPFTLQHPDIPDVSRSNPMVKMLLGGVGLCDTDKYAFCLIGPMVQNEKEGGKLSQMMPQADESAWSELIQNQPLKEADFKQTLRSYVHGLYRFCHLFIHREAFANPFKQNLFLADYTPFDMLLREPDFMARMADFSFKNKSYALALDLYQRIPHSQRTAGQLQKLGYCAEQCNRHDLALQAYLTADSLKPHSAWTLRRLATLHRNKADYAQALNYYNELADISPEDADIALRQAECLIHLKQYDNAFKFLFKANYLAPDTGNSDRALAWCSLLTGKYEQAGQYYAKVLAASPTATDRLNAAHAAWLQGRPTEAFELYRQVVKETGNADFLKEDASLLLDAGLSADDLTMMQDAVVVES